MTWAQIIAASASALFFSAAMLTAFFAILSFQSPADQWVKYRTVINTAKCVKWTLVLTGVALVFAYLAAS